MALATLTTLLQRLVKGAPLTIQEVDNNWQFIQNFASDLITKLGISLADDGSLKRPLVIKGDSTTGNQTYVMTPTSPAYAPAAYADLVGIVIFMKPDFTNTSSAATLRISPLLTDVAIKKQGTKSIAAGDIALNQYAMFHYDGTVFQLLNPQAEATVDYEDTIPNASFEVDATGDNAPDEWTVAAFSGGGGGILESTDQAHGAKALKFTHPGGASTGGGTATSNKFFECSQLRPVVLQWIHKCSAATMRDKVDIVFYDRAKAVLSTVNIYSSITNPTSYTLQSGAATPPANARFFKIVITGGDPAVAVAGTSFWDEVRLVYERLESGAKTSGATLVGGSLHTIAHGLGVKPKQVEIVLVNTSGGTVEGWAANDEIPIEHFSSGGETDPARPVGVSYKDTTNVYIRWTSSGFARTLNKTTGVAFLLTNANWTPRIYAYA